MSEISDDTKRIDFLNRKSQRYVLRSLLIAAILAGLAADQLPWTLSAQEWSGSEKLEADQQGSQDESTEVDVEVETKTNGRPKFLTTGLQYLYQPEVDLDGAGSFQSQSVGANVISRFRLSDKEQLAISLGYIWNNYDWDSGTSMLGTDPWSNVHFMSIGASYRRVLNEKWTFFGIPSVRFAGESDADVEDTIMGGGIFGATYQISDRLSIGPGFGMMTQLEDDAALFPVIFVNWRFADSWSLGTNGGSGAALGPGLQLGWEPNNVPFRASLNANYEQLRFRLDSKASQPNGIGQDQSVRIGADFHWLPATNVDLSAMAGVKVGGEMSIDDSNGNEWRSQKYDTAPFVGLGARMSF